MFSNVMGFFGWVGGYLSNSTQRKGLKTARSGAAEP